MEPATTTLALYRDGTQVGTVHDSTPLAFAYAPAWLARADRLPVAAIALQPGLQNDAPVQAFFENLLPEGELRRYLSEQNKATSLFALLRAVAGDTAGGFVLLAGDSQPEPASYEATTWEALAARLSGRSVAAIDLHPAGTRISLAGAQDKATIAIFEDGLPRLPIGTSASTHILKPDIRRLDKVWASAANEALIMRTSAACGLPTAEVFYEPLTRACVVRRFDRRVRADGALDRLIQYDLCQLAGTPSERKYEADGGPGARRCAELIRQHSVQPAVDLKHFLGWLVFNLYTGNNDSHAKNLSLYRLPGQGLTLTPFYDLMCTRVYPGLSGHFAFSIGGETEPGKLTRTHLDALARELGVRPAFVRDIAQQFAQRLPVALAEAAAELAPALPAGVRTLAARVERYVARNARQMAKRLLAPAPPG